MAMISGCLRVGPWAGNPAYLAYPTKL